MFTYYLTLSPLKLYVCVKICEIRDRLELIFFIKRQVNILHNLCENLGQKSPNFTHLTIISPLQTCRPDSQIYFTQYTKRSIFYNGTNKFLSVRSVAKEIFGQMQIYPQYLNFRLRIVQIFQTSDQHHFNVMAID